MRKGDLVETSLVEDKDEDKEVDKAVDFGDDGVVDGDAVKEHRAFEFCPALELLSGVVRRGEVLLDEHQQVL